MGARPNLGSFGGTFDTSVDVGHHSGGIAEWTGTPLSAVLTAAGLRSGARWLVYYSSDPEWWESIDIDEATHPQTLLAWGMNGQDFPVPLAVRCVSACRGNLATRASSSSTAPSSPIRSIASVMDPDSVSRTRDTPGTQGSNRRENCPAA